jgi:hypothetical protein
MAKDKDPALTHAFFDLLFPMIFPDLDKDSELYAFIRQQLVIETELISAGTMLEQAISVKKGIVRINTEKMDFPDGSDAKTTSVRISNHGKSYGAPIHNIQNKIGLLRVVAYERIQHKFYYFLIPHAAYKDIPKSSNIEIPFNLDGSPKRTSKRIKNVNWWTFEVPNFEGILCDVPAEFEFEYDKKARIMEENAKKSKDYIDGLFKRARLRATTASLSQHLPASAKNLPNS